MPRSGVRLQRRCTGISPWDKVLDDSNAPFPRWFGGGRLNTCFNALDRHVEAGTRRPGRPDPRQSGDRHGAEPHLCRTSGHDRGLRRGAGRPGVEKGDRVIIYMPMVPEPSWRCSPAPGSARSIPSCSAACRHELATRIDDCHPTVVVSASCGIEGSRSSRTSPCRPRDRTCDAQAGTRIDPAAAPGDRPIDARP